MKPSNAQARIFAQSRQDIMSTSRSSKPQAPAASESDEDEIQWTGSQQQAPAEASTSRARSSLVGSQATVARPKKRKTRSPSLEVITKKSSPAQQPQRKRQRVESQVADDSDDDLEIITAPRFKPAPSKRPSQTIIDDDDDDDDLPPPLQPVAGPSRLPYQDEPQMIDSRSSSLCASQSPNHHLPVPSTSAPVPRKVPAAVNRSSKPALARNSSQSKGSSVDSLTTSALAFWDQNDGVMMITDDSPPRSPNTPPSDHEEDEVLIPKARLQPATNQHIATIEDSESDGSPPPLEPASTSFSHREKELAERLEKVYEDAAEQARRKKEAEARKRQYEEANPQMIYDSDDDPIASTSQVQHPQAALVPPPRAESVISSSTTQDQPPFNNDVVMSSRDPSSDIQLGITPDHLVPMLDIDDPVVPMQIEQDPMPIVPEAPFAMQLLPPTPHKPIDLSPIASPPLGDWHFAKYIRISPRHYTTDKTDNLVTHFPASFHLPKPINNDSISLPRPAVRQRLPFLARSLLPRGKQTYQGKFAHLHLALSELGYASSLARLCSPPELDQTRTAPARFDLQYVFGRCGHHQQLDVFRFDGLRCCWCRDLHAFTSPGALMAHLRHSHEACNYLYKPIVSLALHKSDSC